MPNYKLPPSLREHMVAQAKTLCDRRVSLAHDDFPLTREDIQDAAMPPRVRKIVKGLIAEGMQTIQQTHTFHFVLRKDLHSIDRDVVVSAHVSEPMFYFKEIHRYSTSDRVFAVDTHDVDISWLPQEKLTALSKWVNNAVKENRMREVTMSTVAWFLQHACLPVDHITAAHIMARWPTIATLATEKYHQARFREVPAKLTRWDWPENDPAREKCRRAMRLADMVLTSAQMMPKEDRTAKRELSASIIIWEKFPGEKF
jgi:hypothetical protein